MGPFDCIRIIALVLVPEIFSPTEEDFRGAILIQSEISTEL